MRRRCLSAQSRCSRASKVILVGTGESNDALDSYYGQGILRSTDGGKTFALIASADHGGHPLRGLAFSRIAFSTDNSSPVLAATADSPVAGLDGAVISGASLGLYGSSDAGATWSLVELFDAGVPVDASAITSVVYSDTAHAFLAAARDHGFYASADGFNWSRLNHQPGFFLDTGSCPAQIPLGTASSCPIFRGELAVVPGKSEIYAWYVSLDTSLSASGIAVQQGLFLSRDGGNSWSQLDETGFDDCGDLAGCGADQADYNMALTAVPDGSATDVYVGGVNLYRCTILSGTSACMEGEWLNLTHAYGCSPLGAPAKVHPNQHALAFQVVNSKALFFAGNDGGVNRALDAYLGLTSNSCTAGANAFDNLNSSLGSLAEVNGLAQNPTNLAVLLAGSEDNGSVATTTATTSLLWTAVNVGPGGPVAINPASTNEWYTSNPGVSIQKCTSGAASRSTDYQANEVVNSQTLGGDSGGYYAPYQLDPQATGMLLVGTCRVWRGNSDGSGFSTLSFNFETGTDAGCVGSETQVIRALGVGGVAGSNGSRVIYALTEGGFNGSEQVGGKVWVTTNATVGIANFSDATGSINPGNFPLAAIVLDPADTTGATAYVGVMGFGVSHVWKTTDFGADWTDFTGTKTGALPDAPANALLIDTKTGTLYAATDVGMFQTALASASWTESGPTGGPFLPNSAAMQLVLFDSGGERRLRVGTYGRGVWELNLAPKPDYTLTVPGTTSQTVLVGQSTTFSGTLTSLFGYSSSVTLSCAAASTSPPDTCSVSPASTVPTATGKSVTVTASNAAAGDFTFNLQGADSSKLTRTAPLTLHVTDYSLGAPSPASVVLGRPDTSSAITMQVTPLGMLTGTATLSCSGLPTGGTCTFTPSATVSLTPGNAVSVTMKISVLNTTPIGNSTVTITAALSGSTLKRTQTVALQVIEGGDFALATVTPFSAVTIGQTATATASVSAINSFSPSTSLSCSGAGLTCTVSPATVSKYPANVTLTVPTSGVAEGSYSVTLTGTGGSLTHTLGFTLSVSKVGDFALATLTPFPPVTIGQTATATIAVSATNSFTPSTSLSCSGAGITCSVNPATVSQYPMNVTLTVPTSGVAAGNYTVTLSGTSGALSHSLGLTLAVSDFTLATVAPFAAVTAGQSATATASVSGINSLAATTTLSCSGTVITCSVAPASVAVYPANVTLTVPTTGLAPGAYAVTLNGSSGSLSHTLGLTFTVNPPGDFALATVTPFAAVTSGQSASATVSLSAINSLSASTGLNCSGTGITCSVTPATVSQYPTNVTVTMPTAGLAAGGYPITLTGTSGSLTHSLALTANVTDFSVTPPTSAASAIFPGTAATLTFSLRSQNAYAGSVNAACDVSAFGAGTTCTLSPANPIALASGSATVTATVSVPASVAAGSYNANLTATDAATKLSHDTGSLITVTDYQFAPASGSSSLTITAGQQANYTLDVNPANGAFAATLTFTCSGLPSQSNCLFSPSSLTLNGPPSSVTMTIATKSNVAAISTHSDIFYAFIVLFPAALGMTLVPARRRWPGLAFALLVLLTLTVGIACGGGSSSPGPPPPPPPPSGTPVGMYPITINATAKASSNGVSLTHSTQVTLMVQ